MNPKDPLEYDHKEHLRGEPKELDYDGYKGFYFPSDHTFDSEVAGGESTNEIINGTGEFIDPQIWAQKK